MQKWGYCVKTTKLVMGILSIIFSCFIMFQSCAAGASNALKGSKEKSGSVGLLVAILLLTGAIIMIATRNGGKGSSVACVILFLLGAIIGFPNAGTYKDLKIWAVYCIVLAMINLISVLTYKEKKSAKKRVNEISLTQKSITQNQQSMSSAKNASEELQQYKKMLDDGLITEEDFEVVKKQILDI